MQRRRDRDASVSQVRDLIDWLEARCGLIGADDRIFAMLKAHDQARYAAIEKALATARAYHLRTVREPLGDLEVLSVQAVRRILRDQLSPEPRRSDR